MVIFFRNKMLHYKTSVRRRGFNGHLTIKSATLNSRHGYLRLHHERL